MTASLVYIVYEAGNFRPALELCRAVKSTTLLRPLLFSPYYLPETPMYIEAARAEGVSYIHESTALGGDADIWFQAQSAGLARKDRSVRKASGRTRNTPLRARVAAKFLHALNSATNVWMNHYEARLDIAERFLDLIDASVVILPEDNVERDSSCWVDAIRRRRGKAVVISTGSVTPHEAAIAYFNNPHYAVTTPEDRLFIRIYPKWSMTWRKKRMLRLPTPRALALERLRLAPRLPWVVNSGDVDAIVVESDFHGDLFARHGISRGLIKTLGNPAQDVLARAASGAKALSSGAATGQQKPVLLCAVPPNQYPGVTAPEFPSYAALVDAWVDLLSRYSAYFQPVISPHPNIGAEYIERMRRSGIEILEGGVASWLPSCDLYLASVSSTIKWARACGKPVLNYDCYRYQFEDLEDAEGITTVFDLPAAERYLSSLSVKPNWDAAVAQAMTNREYWGRLDGEAMRRLVDYVASDRR